MGYAKRRTVYELVDLDNLPGGSTANLPHKANRKRKLKSKEVLYRTFKYKVRNIAAANPPLEFALAKDTWSSVFVQYYHSSWS